MEQIKNKIKKMPKKDKVFYTTVFSVFLISSIITHTLISISYIPEGSISMEPGIKAGSFVVGSRTFTDIKNGDIVFFNYEEENKVLVKRIIASEGQTVRFSSDAVFVDEKMLNETYLKEPGLYAPMEVVVPKGCYFVLGDHRNVSKDSRYFGCIKQDDIIAVKK